MKHELIKTADIPETGSRIVPFFGREVHVYRAGENIKAVANACMHFGGPLECKEGKFVCAWHGATFDVSTGDRIGCPSPRGSRLMFLSTRVEDGTLYYVWGE